MDQHDLESFFAQSPPPWLADSCAAMRTFVEANAARKLVLVTSGGTSVPLEKNTVRFIDNFSTGARGAACAEAFLQAGYAVIFASRKGSLSPYLRDISLDSLTDALSFDEAGRVQIADEAAQARLRSSLEARSRALAERRLLLVPFVSVHDYLWLLRGASLVLASAPCSSSRPPCLISSFR